MAGPIRIAILANGSQSRREIASVGNSADTLGRKFGNLGRTAATGLALGAGAVAALGLSAIRSASESQQSLGATESVFKRYSNTVIERSERAAEAVGLSANEYRELANVTGAMLKNSGAPLKEVTDLTDKLTNRAADLAATYGGTTREAIEAVNSLLRGEADPIERYGVSIKQSDVNARLAAQGLGKLEGAAKKQAEQQARLELLFGQTSDAAGQFKRETSTLAGQQQRLTAEFENAKSELGTSLLPVATDFIGFLRAEGVPALQEFSDWLADNSDEISETASALGNTLLPPAKATAEVFAEVTRFVAGLSPEMRNLVGTVGLAALVVPRLNSVVGAAGNTFSTFAANQRDAQRQLDGTASRSRRVVASLGALGNGARNVAGIGGLAALQQGATSSNKALGALANVGGGALLGFSVGGPIGAAIGAEAGGLVSLYQAINDAGNASSEAAPKHNELKASLDQVSGAATEATRSLVLQRLESQNLTAAAANFGISQRTLVDAALGNEQAMGRLDAALASAASSFDVSGAGANGLQIKLDALRDEFGTSAAAIRENSAIVTDYTGKLKGLPNEVKTEVRANGIVPTAEGIADLARRYNLTPKQITTLIKASGADTTRKQVLDVVAGLEGVKGAKGNPARWSRELLGGVSAGKSAARSGGSDVGNLLTQGTGKAKANLQPFNQGLNNGISGARGIAASGGNSIGAALANGASAGIFARIGNVAAQAAAMVRQAVAAANAAGEVRSPSRKTRRTGEALGDGLDQGMRRRRGKVKAGGASIGQAAVDGVVNGLEGIDDLLDSLDDRIGKSGKGKGAKQRRQAIRAELRAEYEAIRANGRAQDDVNARLEQARETVANLIETRNQYAATIRDSVTSFGNITDLGRLENGAVSLRGLLAQLQTRADQADKFRDLLVQLSNSGLSEAQIQQMLSAGPEAALATAQAIASGGDEAIAQLNALTARLGNTGTALGELMASKFHDAGIQAARGLVSGLEAEQANLDNAARGMADALVKRVKRRLGIRSPSKVFEGIATDSVRGLGTPRVTRFAERQGTRLAGHLADGFGTPALDAYTQRKGLDRDSFATSLRDAFAQTPQQASHGAPLIGQVNQQPGQSTEALAEQLWFLLRSRG